MILRISIVLGLLVAIVAAPFLLRPKEKADRLLIGGTERVVIITPHNESIQTEFGRGFKHHMKQKYDREVYIDWRVPGGTSEIARFLKSEYTIRFEQLWENKTGLPFKEVRDAFSNRKVQPLDEAAQQSWIDDPTLLNREDSEIRQRAARTMFLSSDIGVGIDMFFGGGAYDFTRQAQAGNLVGEDASGKFGPAALNREHPDWFSDEIMPEMVSGEPFRDPEFRWVGTVLSSFGITYNTDVLKRLGIKKDLTQWEDLVDPRLAGQIALADPTKSGSTTKALEMLIQEQILKTIRENPELPEDKAVRKGWDRALLMLLKISSNARYFTDSATKVPHDVAQGDAAAGMSIDFYGRTYNELHKHEDGSSRVQFVMPRGGTSIGADPIGMLRGAPNPELTHKFIEFVLSSEGQRLWNYRPGSKGGPARFALRRPPIRRDFYTAENEANMTDPDVNPYEIAKDFTYHGEWTGALFTPLRFIIRCACVETHEEQRKAWEALIEAGMPADALAEFEDLEMMSYDRVLSDIAPVLNAKDKVAEVELARELAGVFRDKYKRVRKMARAHSP